eukprot:CAMPEP_0176484408 /NCGR_PEP_ID=MMETSP0200_2-20121128/4438_1 /TAXON_ID=947934 /ORGANISM="Chaetoceros sp., Strain GSL56" /LENGTH=518 /DNA_ID=CAMNT_0017880879 /DNA_START=71 /DNA_END=1627 /DNA_ORIENTATION=+
MNSAVPFLAFLIVTTSTVAQGDTFSPEGRIIGGTDVPFGTYPWFAKARIGDDWGGCGGMLVAKEWVMTAAHCVTRGDYPAFEIGAICHDGIDASSNGNCGQVSDVISTLKTISHPDYDDASEDNDFALVKLASPASATPVNMDLGGVVNTYNSNSPLWAIGFGNQDANGGSNFPGRLQHVEVNFVPQSTCNSNYFGGITSNMFCAADPGQDSCQGDSGGPLYDAVNKILVGVVSWGNGCAQTGFPGVYAKIFAQREWIVNTICSDSTDLPAFCNGFTQRPTISPSPSAFPTVSASPTVQCFNVPYYFDQYGDKCAWYGVSAERCDAFGDTAVGTSGLTPNEACCECGGGTTSPPPKCNDTLGWTDSFGDSCTWYEVFANLCDDYGTTVGTDGQTANDACCVCGGGTTTCEDDSNFTFQLNNGKTEKCGWLTKNPNNAPIRKSRYCGRTDVSNACRETCGICVNTCNDDPNFTFKLNNGKTRRCAWFTKNPNKAPIRISRYCVRSDVSTACGESCGTCV